MVHQNSHFGPYIFTMALMPLLKAAALAPDSDVRIVNTGTNAHRLFISDNYPLDFSSPALWSAELPYMPWVWNYFGRFCFKNDMVRYGLSKLTLAMLTRDLQRRLDAANIPIICTSPHPGAVATPGLHELVTPMFLVIVRLVFLSEDQGSWHQLFMATDKAVRQDPERYKGVYFEQFGTPHPGHASLRNEEACRQVWENTAKEVDSYLSKAGLEALPKW